jgi:hypothetical protein
LVPTIDPSWTVTVVAADPFTVVLAAVIVASQVCVRLSYT